MKFIHWFKGLTTSSQVLLAGTAIATIFALGASAINQPPNLTSDSDKSSQSKSQTTTKTETEIENIPFASTTVEDATMAKGTTRITTAGANGSKTLIYKVIYKDGKKQDKKLVKTDVTLQPITQVTSVGTYVAPSPPPQSSCDPNYSGCVPIASDVDCAGGSGNGPAYTSGPVSVIGSDIYGLDRDGDGVGCE